MDTITLTNPIDMHIHLRQDSMLQAVLPYSAKPFSAFLAMPNLNPPLTTIQSVLHYRESILQYGKAIHIPDTFKKESYFMPIMSLYLHDDLTQEEIQLAAQHDIKILKLYPKGATTNSENGITEVLSKKLLSLLDEAQKHSMILSIHGETSGFSLQREREFLKIFEELARSFPQLKIIVEHLSDRHSIELIKRFSNLFGTITLHHMTLTLDNVLGGMLNPYAFCKPILKTPQDRDAILEIALSGDSQFSFGSDSAPHTIQAKQGGAAGIFQAPILLESLCMLFAKHKKLENLQSFISDNAINIYDIELPFTKIVTLHKKPFTFGKSIQTSNGDIAVLMGENELEYCVHSIEVS